MESEYAQLMVSEDFRNAEVLFPYINGQDVNSNPTLAASRWVINFHDWPVERAAQYYSPFNHVVGLVKPERLANSRKIYRDLWWQHAEKRPAMIDAISGLKRVIVLALVSKTVMPVLVPTGQVFSNALGIFATDDTAMLALLSSAPHYWWAVSRASTMKTDLRYTPSDVFEKFPLPALSSELRELGDAPDTFRRDVMLARNSGLTKTYNLVFDPTVSDADIVELRRIHREIDIAAIKAYGWDDLLDQLDHGFHPAGRDLRYTIGPAAQREILDRLLELNHARYAEEVAAGLHDKKKGRKAAARPEPGGLF